VQDRAFFCCYALEKLYVPKSVVKWGNFVTYFCKDLAKWEYEGTLEDWNNIECIARPEGVGSEKVVGPNESLSMYLTIKAPYVECSDGKVNIKEVLEKNGFKSDNITNEDIEG
ncbi:MAG: hypothetical protein IIV11_07150, partial [Clostridia bacterium]|nr:hypothetical protein [Clostridia bacterium]